MRGMRGISGAAPLVALIATLTPSADAATTARWADYETTLPLDAAHTAIEAMNRGFYNGTDGRWDTSDAWWLSGNALQTVADYMLVTGNLDYLPLAEHTVRLQSETLPWWPKGDGYFRTDSTDDTGWWALAMVRLFDLTGSSGYLDVAKLDEAYMYSFWNTSTCNGGLIWDIRHMTYKNAISNELYMKLAVSLHNRIPGDGEYLQRALESWRWFKNSGMINSASLVNDGLAEGAGGACSNNGQTTWTYNQGVVLGALAELHVATGDTEYLEMGKQIADAVIASEKLSPGGILTEPCDAGSGCNSDQATFKGIFARNLAELNAVLGGWPYREYLVRNAESAWRNARNGSDFFSVSWTGPAQNITIGSQASAASLFTWAF